MSDKLQSASARSSPLPDITALTLRGRDCIAFAQAQFMSDVASLADGQWQWSGWLSPKGRVLALFAVLRHTSERLDLIVLDEDAETLATSLKRFVFRSKVAVEVRSDLQASGSLSAPKQAQAAHAAIDADVIELDFGSAMQARTLILGAPGTTSYDAAQHTRWRVCDLAHGLPRLDAGQREQWTPQQLSLERLRAFSVSKGCYPGQEIIARTHFLGQAKRGAVALRGVEGALPGQDVGSADGQSLGRLASVAGDLALAVLPIERVESGLQVNGCPVVELPLLEGLAR